MVRQVNSFLSPIRRSSLPSSVYSEHIDNITLASRSVQLNSPISIRPSLITIRSVLFNHDLSLSFPGVVSGSLIVGAFGKEEQISLYHNDQ
jgi:hypothetical protein